MLGKHSLLSYTCCELKMRNILPAPNQRAKNPEKISQIVKYIRENPLFLHKPISVVTDNTFIWIIDGQHRLDAYKFLCSEGLHNEIEVIVKYGNEASARESFRMELMSEPLPNISNLDDSKLILHAQCVAYTRTRFPGFVSDKKRPNIDIIALATAYIDSFEKDASLDNYKNLLERINWESQMIIHSVDLGEKNKHRCNESKVWIGLTKSSNYKNLFLKYKSPPDYSTSLKIHV